MLLVLPLCRLLFGLFSDQRLIRSNKYLNKDSMIFLEKVQIKRSTDTWHAYSYN